MNIKARVRGILEGQLNNQYAVKLAREKRRISYERWLELQEDAETAAADVRTSADAIATADAAASADGKRLGTDQLAEQGICLILQRRGKLDLRAVSWIAGYFAAHPETQVLYGDEDVLDADGKHRYSPYFKPDWSPDTWLSCFYLGSVIAVRRELAERLPQNTSPFLEIDSEGILYYTDTAQIRLPVHQLLELAGGFTRGVNAVTHLPRMLFHMDHDAAEAGMQKKYRQADGFACPGPAVSELIRPEITVSVIIPSKDNPQVLEQCLESLQKCQESMDRMEKTGTCLGQEGGLRPVRLEILVVDNGSKPENKEQIEKITHGMKYIYEPMPFNFSRMCNLGARVATGELLLFLNDDITVCGDCWLAAMADRALRSYVGAVGLKLYYPDSRRIQHAGITNLPGGPVHKLQFTEDGQEEDYGYGSLDRNVIAVTGACLMVQRERFRQVGGFPEDLQVAYNDVDLCFSLREAGWHNVVLNRYHAYHHESLSRGSDLTREKLLRLRQERQALYTRHPAYLDRDPYYPEPLCRELGDTHIYETYIDSRAASQVVSHCKRLEEFREQESEDLTFSVQLAVVSPEEEEETAGTGEKKEPAKEPLPVCLQGYIVVKWENNACYNNCLLLQKQENDAGIYIIRLEPKYSREAEYGMQEQPNVALCGFRAALQKGTLPDGSYRIGVQARSRLGRRRLAAWTEQTVQVRGGMFARGGDFDSI